MRVAIFVVICLAAIGLFLSINQNKNDQGEFLLEQQPSLEQQRREQDRRSPEQRRWDSLIEETRRDGTYKVLSVEESRKWLAKYSAPDNYAVEDTDPDGNLRVFLPIDPPPPPDDNYLSVTESRMWLERRGYSISREGTRYIVTKEGIGYPVEGIEGRVMLPSGDNPFLIKTDPGGVRVRSFTP